MSEDRAHRYHGVVTTQLASCHIAISVMNTKQSLLFEKKRKKKMTGT